MLSDPLTALGTVSRAAHPPGSCRSNGVAWALALLPRCCHPPAPRAYGESPPSLREPESPELQVDGQCVGNAVLLPKWGS